MVAALLAGGTAAAQDVVVSAASGKPAGKWAVAADSTASNGKVMRHSNAGAAKLPSPLASPSNYFEVTFYAEKGKAYRLWMRGRAQSDYWGNDSVFVQFSGSVTSSGGATWRIGTTSAMDWNLEDCKGCGLNGWKWQDNGWGSTTALGPTVYFASTGTQRMRVQTREDGLSLDQIVLSPSTYMFSPPGGTVGSSSGGSTTATDVVLQASSASPAGKWVVASSSTAFGGKLIRHPDAGAAKLSGPRASPANYFELSFNAVAGVGYRLWMHGRADGNYWGNDSVFAQFSGSVTSSGSAIWRIGTTSAMAWNLEDCSGCGLNGWQWQDNGWGSKTALGPLVYFKASGPQTIRVQTREDGLSLDRIILSPSTYLTSKPPGSTTTTSPEPEPEPSPEPEPLPPPSTSTGSTLKVLTWNIHHGVGTDGKYNIDRIAAWIAKTGAHVVSLNEVEKYTGWGNENQPARFASLLKSKTGKTWYYKFAQRDGNTNGQGNLLLSSFPLESSGDYELSASRSVARVAIIVNGLRVNVFSTHLDNGSQSTRVTQMKQLLGWSSTYPQQRIIAGDFNCYGSYINTMTDSYYDAWAQAVAKNVDVAYSGNSSGTTYGGIRIDYVFHSKSATRLTLTRMQIFNTRDSSGVSPSDHRPIMATYTVK